MNQRKKCVYCGRSYKPDPRTRLFQKACGRPGCRRKRKSQAQARWLAANPGYYRGQYPRLKVWLKEHPGYLKSYRARHLEYVARDNERRRTRRERGRADIQDAMYRREVARLKGVTGADIQDTMRLQVAGILELLAQSGRADMQDDMVMGGPLGLRSGHGIGEVG